MISLYNAIHQRNYRKRVKSKKSGAILPGKSHQPQLCRKQSWALNKLIKNYKSYGNNFCLSYKFIASQMSEAFKKEISDRWIRDYFNKLKKEALLSIKQIKNSKMSFDVLNINALIEKRDAIESEISSMKRNSDREIDCNPRDLWEPTESINVSHREINCDPPRVCSGPTESINVNPYTLSSTQSITLSSTSSNTENDVYVEKTKEVDSFYKAAHDATVSRFGSKIDETIRFIHEMLVEADYKAHIYDVQKYANKMADNLKVRGHGYGNPYAHHNASLVEQPKQKTKSDLEYEAFIAEHGPIKTGGGYPGKQFLMRQLIG